MKSICKNTKPLVVTQDSRTSAERSWCWGPSWATYKTLWEEERTRGTTERKDRKLQFICLFHLLGVSNIKLTDHIQLNWALKVSSECLSFITYYTLLRENDASLKLMKFSMWLLSTDTTHSGEIGTKKKVKRLLSFQRYFHASRLLRGIIPQAPLHLLDEDYLGQARVSQLPTTGSGQGPVTQLTAPGSEPYSASKGLCDSGLDI